MDGVANRSISPLCHFALRAAFCAAPVKRAAVTRCAGRASCRIAVKSSRMARTRLVAGNWKMHGSRASNRALLDAILKSDMPKGVECVVCPPFPYLAAGRRAAARQRRAWGAQNVSEHAQGAYTGEVSAAMLPEFGCRYVIVGHSERRQLYGETDAQVAAQVRRGAAAGLTPILCVGETLAEREAGATRRGRGAAAGRGLAAAARCSQTRCWPTSRCGRSAPGERHARAGAGGARAPRGAADARRRRQRSCTAAASRRRMRRRSSPCRTSTAGWSAARRWWRKISCNPGALQDREGAKMNAGRNVSDRACTCWSALAIIGLVLLQHGKGADMGAGFGGGPRAACSAPPARRTSFRARRRSSRRCSSSRASRSPISGRSSGARGAAGVMDACAAGDEPQTDAGRDAAAPERRAPKRRSRRRHRGAARSRCRSDF